MICPQCSAENGEQSSNCSKCGSSFDLFLDVDRTLDAAPIASGSAAEAPAPRTTIVDRVGAVLSGSGSGSTSRTGARSATLIYGVFAPGDELGCRYRIERMLGQGGMGRVYKAYDTELERSIALKVLQPELTTDANAMQRFKQELLLASRISHKNILRIHDLGDADGVKFISMAFVDGPDLHHVLQEAGRLPIERAHNIAMQLCEGLDAAHSEGVVHRDLKPQNILMGPGDHVYISDFGLAKSLESSTSGMTRTGQFLGTPRYMAPEQVETGPIDNRTDLYALGLILFEMVTGESPFKGDSTLQVMYKRVKEKAPNPQHINSEVPAYMAGIILHCLERDPARRYQDAKEVLADLRAAHAPASKGLRIPLPEMRKHWWIGTVTALVLAGLLAIPQIRHLLSGRADIITGASGIAPAGVPPLARGRFIAVLPVQVLGNAAQLGYVAQGIQEALSAKLFQLKDVRTTATDTAAATDPKEPLPKIARALGANLLVQGSLQGAGDRIRIDVSLEDVADSKQLWSKEFTGVTADLFTLEDQIYSQLVAALNVTPTGDEMARAAVRPTDNLAAYDLYLRGRRAMRGHQGKDIQSALDYFNQAAGKDPSFALAYTGVADASLRMYGIKKDSFWTDKALAAAEQAKQLNGNLPEVHFALGSAESATGKYNEAVAELKRAVALAPNSDEAYRRLGDAYSRSGNTHAAIQSFQTAVQLNPYFWNNQDEIGNAYFQLGDYAKALDAFHQITVLAPDIDAGYENMGNVYLREGKYKDCIPYYQKALQIEPYWTTYSNLGTAYFFLKQYADSASAYEKAVALNPNDSEVVVNLADAYRWSGQQDKARQTYQQAISLGYKELQTDPQDATTMAQIALSYAKIGNAQQAQRFIGRARALAENNVDYIYDEGEIDAILNQQDGALKALRQAFEKHYPVNYASGDQELENLQSNPKFTSLIREFSAKKP